MGREIVKGNTGEGVYRSERWRNERRNLIEEFVTIIAAAVYNFLGNNEWAV